ncbi:hypothetical protein ACFLZ1_05040 [Patescibacteria group bacterium]
MKNKTKLYLVVWSLVVFLFYFFVAKNKTFFLRDDYDVLTVLLSFNPGKILLPHNEHFFPLLRIAYWVQYIFFSLDYSKYLGVQIIYHLITSIAVFFTIYHLTKKLFYAFAGFICFSLTAGASYKIFVLLISQIWLLEALFASFTLLFYTKSINKNKLLKKPYLLSLFFAVLTVFVSPIGGGLLLAIFLINFLYFRKQKKYLVLPILLFFASVIFYLVFAHRVSLGVVKENVGILYPLYVLRYIILGFVWGTVLQLFFPWFNLLRPFPKILSFKLGIAFISIIGLALILLFLARQIKKHKKISVYIFTFISFTFFHFLVIGLGRINNMGYALSPQYTYFPRLVFIVFLFYFLKKTRFSNKATKKKFLLLLTWFVVLNQGLYFYYQMVKWKYRADYTKQYILDLKYIFENRNQVLNLYCPDSISPVMKYSNMAAIFYPDKEIIFINKDRIDIDTYLEEVKKDKKIYEFYQKAKGGFDIDHY